MAGFDPDDGLFLDVRAVFAIVRAADPGAGGVFAVLVVHRARQDENFFTAEMLMLLVARPGRPFVQRDHLGFVVIQRHDPDIVFARQPGAIGGVDAQADIVGLVELVELDQ